MNKYFQIGGFSFQLIYPKELILPANFCLFETEEIGESYTYEISFVENLPVSKGKIIARKADILVYENEGKETRYLGIKGMAGFYGCSKEVSSKKTCIYVTRAFQNILISDTVFLSLFALESKLIDQEEAILHCAYMEYKGEGILFSAPSETGKTTQATLWEKYRGSNTINGDRALLRKKNNTWYACGWPVCGSSEVCHNKEIPIRAIVMLSQSEQNTINRIKKARAFSLLYPQITINSWDKKRVDKSMELIENLIQEVEVLHLSCNISEDAVKCLEQFLVSK